MPGKDGKPDALYVDLVLFETPDSQYGDFIVKQQVTKEEREKKVAMPILGNAKNWERGQQRRQDPPDAPGGQPKAKDSDDVPF